MQKEAHELLGYLFDSKDEDVAEAAMEGCSYAEGAEGLDDEHDD